MRTRSAVRPATRTSPLAVAGAAVVVASLTVARWPAADAQFTVIKCCPAGEAFAFDVGCVPKNKTENGRRIEFKVPKTINESGAFDFYSANEYTLRYEMLECEDILPMYPKRDPGESFNITETGEIQSINGNYYFKEHELCYEEIFENGDFFDTVLFCVNPPGLVPNDTRDHYSKTAYSLSVDIYVMMISFPFFLSTFVVYAIFKKRKTLEKKLFVLYIGNLLASNVIHILNQLYTTSITETSTICDILAYLNQFMFLSCFSWLNVICFDRWQYIHKGDFFKNERTTKLSIKLIKYSMFAEGYPILIILFTFLGSINYLRYLPDPKIGKLDRCWIGPSKAQLVYFHVPAAILVIPNALICFYVMITLYKLSERTNNLDENRSLIRNYEKFKLFLKLSFTMGISWTISVVIEIMKLIGVIEEKSIFMISLNIGNAAQGLLIFVILVCDKTTLRMINNTFCSRIRLLTNESTENSTQMMSSLGTISGN